VKRSGVFFDEGSLQWLNAILKKTLVRGVSVRVHSRRNELMTLERSAEVIDRQRVILKQLKQALQTSGYAELRGLHCDCDEGILTLSGSLPSYYLKQQAQAIALRVASDFCVDNKIVVQSTSAPISANLDPIRHIGVGHE
jgi:osmotically-inducible protein OsmY